MGVTSSGFRDCFVSGKVRDERLHTGSPLESWVRTAWLVAIDLQGAFLEASSPWAVLDGASAIDGVSRIVKLFGPRTVHTRFVPPAEPAGSWEEYYHEWWPFALDPSAAELWSLRVQWPVAACVDSFRLGKWQALLRFWHRRPSGVVVCGVATDVCVLATSIAAVDDGVPVIVVEDACAAASEEAHAFGIAWLGARRGQVRVCNSEELVAAYERLVGGG